jgi:cytoskeletal protein RodZ
MRDSFGPDLFSVVHVVGTIVYGVVALLAFAIAVGLIFLLVRFLLVGTRAAQIYVARNGSLAPTKTAASPVTDAPTAKTPDHSADTITEPSVPTTTPAGTSTAPTVAEPVAIEPDAPTTPLPPVTPPLATGTATPKTPRKTTPRAPKTPPAV